MALSATMRTAYDELIEATTTARALAITYYAGGPDDDGDADLCDQLVEWEEKVQLRFEEWLAITDGEPDSPVDQARNLLRTVGREMRNIENNRQVRRRFGVVIAAIEAAIEE